MFCTNCGKKLHDGDRFCGNCGTKVREEAPTPKSSQEVVFNPPFKVEAERRTSEIFRGFATETPKEEKTLQTEPAHFDWNLDGFPKNEPRKTEEVNFNWDSVIERRKQQKVEEQKVEQRQTSPIPVIDKIDIRQAAEAEEGSSIKSALHVEPVAEDTVVTEAAMEESVTSEPSNTGHASGERSDNLAGRGTWELTVPEMVAAEETKAAGETKAVQTAEPEKKPETIVLAEHMAEIPELILPVGPAAEKPVAEPEAEMEAKKEEPAMSVEELEAELFGKNYRGVGAMAPEENLKSTAQLEKFYTYNKKNEEFQQLLDKEYERLRNMEEERQPEQESLEFTWATTLFPERKTEEASEASSSVEGPVTETTAEEMKPAEEDMKTEDTAETVPAATIDFSAVREEARQKKQQNEVPSEEETKEETAEKEEETPSCSSEQELFESDSQPADGPSENEQSENGETANGQTADGIEEKNRLRYSDVFPRESLDDNSNDGNSASAVGATKIFEGFEEDDEEDEPKKMNFFIKLIIILLVLLIILEGVILLARFIAPESEFSVKANDFVESIMDRITGGDGQVQNEDNEAVNSDLSTETYISDLLAEKIEKPDSIGEVLEDSDLKYDLEKDYAFEEIAQTTDFENGDWKTDADGETVTYAEGILDTVVGYFGQWQATNRDTSLIGINKLEIGEIRTGEMGYYVLCRLTFAGADGDEVVKYVTACVKISQDSMVNNKIEEEKL